ncbi:hypothetical protein Tco_0579776, partial [Tanacetum coccineum]
RSSAAAATAAATPMTVAAVE